MFLCEFVYSNLILYGLECLLYSVSVYSVFFNGKYF